MKLVIELKQTATIERVLDFYQALKFMKSGVGIENDYSDFSDVIENITRDKEVR
jgi:hypothetical protein